MRLDNVLAITKREYMQRAKTKGFWIGTLIVPLFAFGVFLIPIYLLQRSQASQTIVVVDETGRVGQELVARMNSRNGKQQPRGERSQKGMVDESEMARFSARNVPVAADPKAQKADLDRQVQTKQIDAWVWISPGVFKEERAEYHARSVANFMTQNALEEDLSWVVRRERLRQAGVDPGRVDELVRPVKLDTQRVSEKGSRAEGGAMGFLFSIGLFMLLYISMIMWGQQVMNGVLEEKGSRVIEVLMSSVTSFELLMGKLIGIGLLGLTQLGIWLGTMFVISSPGIGMALAMKKSLPSMSVAMLIHFVLLFILGFFAFATLYAALGSAFNNIQEAQQMAGVVMMFIIVPALMINPVINDPNSTMATVLSLIPLFTPLLMPLRISVEMPPAWQLALAYALTVGFVILMVWFCSKIYRIGILMYGKKPTIQEIWKWTKYA